MYRPRVPITSLSPNTTGEPSMFPSSSSVERVSPAERVDQPQHAARNRRGLCAPRLRRHKWQQANSTIARQMLAVEQLARCPCQTPAARRRPHTLWPDGKIPCRPAGPSPPAGSQQPTVDVLVVFANLAIFPQLFARQRVKAAQVRAPSRFLLVHLAARIQQHAAIRARVERDGGVQ